MPESTQELARPVIRDRVARIDSCPVCEGTVLTQYLKLGTQPIANRLLTAPDDPSPRYPLGVQVCAGCGLSMLTHMVRADEVYKDYPFLSGTSKQWVKHCEMLAKAVRCPEGNFPLVVDIGSNDGTLGRAFQRAGWCVVGVEPNQPEGTESSFMVKPVYWSKEEGHRARTYIAGGSTHRPDLIVATNVFGHSPDPLDFLRGIKQGLRNTGVAIIECQHVGFMQQHWAFDTVYHEHLWFWWTKPMVAACERTGLEVVDIEYLPNLHTGSVRYWIRHEGYDGGKSWRWQRRRRTRIETERERVAECLANEEGHLNEMEPYREFGDVVVETVEQFRRIFTQPNRPVLAGYGASAKAATMLNALKATVEEITCVVDDAASKQGKFLPGSKIPIVAEIPKETEVLILFSWNVAASLMRKALDAGYEGMFLVPLPELKTYNTEEADRYVKDSIYKVEVEERQELIYA